MDQQGRGRELTMAEVKVGILGAGGIAKVHASNLMKDERVQVVGVADIAPERAASLAHEVGDAKSVQRIEELFELGVDAVYVTTPNTLHVEPVLKCLKNDVHVFSEKPMATSLDEAKQIREQAKQSKAIYNLGMNRRFALVYKRVKELIASGELTPYLAHIKMNRGELLNPVWTADPTVTGGFLFETPVHLIDLCRYLFGEVETVRCAAKQNLSEKELDTFAITLTFQSGTIANFVTYAHAGWSFPFESIEVYGKYATVATQEMEKVMVSLGLNQTIQIDDYYQISTDVKWGYVEEDRRFIDAILDGTEPPVSVEDAYRSAVLIDAIYESANTGKEVDLTK